MVAPAQISPTGKKTWLWIVLAVPAIFVLVIVGWIVFDVAKSVKNGGSTCKPVAIMLDPSVKISDAKTPFTLSATVTSEGKPLKDAEVRFVLYTDKPFGIDPHNTEFATSAGSAVTGPDGVARFTAEHGLEGTSIAPARQRVIGYKATFKPLDKINDVHYCFVMADDSEITPIADTHPQ